MRSRSTTTRLRGAHLVVATALAVLLSSCGTPTEEPGAAEPDQPETEEPDTEDPDTEEPETEEPETEDPETEEPDAEDPDAEDPDTEDPSADPVPDPAAVEDPCAAHEGREDDAFIDVVAPVQDQVVSGTVELVGCSNVFEATVAYELYDGDGRLLDEGFTTAECGTGCVGAFRETVSLEAAAGEPVVLLQVFSENQADEAERQLSLVEVQLVLE